MARSSIADPTPELRESTPRDAYAVRLALTFESWVHRRVERFDFVNAKTVRRQMSVDFEMPGDSTLVEDEMVLVPVMVQKRGLLRGVDVLGADGCSLNVLESEENRIVTLAGLQALIKVIAGIAAEEVPTDTLAAILNEDPKKATKIATHALGDNGALKEALTRHRPWDDEGIETLAALIRELAAGFLLLVWVPFRPGARHLIKVRYDARIDGAVRRFFRNPRSWATIRLLYSRLFSTVGLAGRIEYLTGMSVRLGKSYHAEIIPPAGTHCEEANLSILGPEEENGSEAGVVPLTEGVYRDSDRSRPHLWVGGGGETNRGEQGWVEVVLHAGRDGLMFPLFFSTAVIAAVLAYVPTQDGHLDGITLGALLLAPVALAAYYARSDENAYLTTAMRGARGLATVAVIAAVMVIGLIGLGYIQPHSVGGDTVLHSNHYAIDLAHIGAWVSLGCAVVLALAMLAPFVNELVRRVVLGSGRDPRVPGARFSRRDALLLVSPSVVLVAAGLVFTWWVAGYLPI